MDQRAEFVRLAEAGAISIAELCRRFGISRDTGHRLLARVRAEGSDGLLPRSRRPHNSPRRSPPEAEQAVLALRRCCPSWGGRKIARRLADQGVSEVVHPSTVTRILHRHGCIAPAASERAAPWRRFERAAPNALWQMDFKGHLPLETGGRCHPLTVIDDHSRYALGLRACANETDSTVRAQLTSLFRRYGLPDEMLADNGSPWGAPWSAPGPAYTALGVWLLLLGIGLAHGKPYHPQTQGKVERLHATLKVELLQHQRLTDLANAQQRFDAWRHCYNAERPHDALGLATPASRYRPSSRAFPERLAEPLYAAGDTIRRVARDGSFRFKGATIRLSQAFAGRDVALRPTATDGQWSVHFSRFAIARLDLREAPDNHKTVRHVRAHLSDMSPV